MRRRILTLLASATASGSGSGSGARLGRASWESRAMRPNPPSIGPWSSPRRGLGLAALAGATERFARLEGLDAHAESVVARVERAKAEEG